MLDSYTAPPEQPVDKSILHKPLHDLTDDDISQLTREDCRRYLKEKGMRRPSWNKSQAIQQVISLKKLLEPDPNSESSARRKRLLVPTKNDNDNAKIVVKGDSVGRSRPEDSILGIKENSTVNFGSAGELACRTNMEDNEALTRTTYVSEMPLGQMTIFYCGKVNVYDDVTSEKAQVLLHLAASPPHLPQDALYDGTMIVQSSACQLQVVTDRTGSGSNPMLLPAPQPVRTSDSCRVYGELNKSFHDDNCAPEGQGSRKASVQRYLEKRKDRFKSKRKVDTTPSAGIDIYYNHQLGNELNQHPNKGDACSLPQIRPPDTPVRCSSPEDQARSAGLNSKIKD